MYGPIRFFFTRLAANYRDYELQSARQQIAEMRAEITKVQDDCRRAVAKAETYYYGQKLREERRLVAETD